MKPTPDELSVSDLLALKTNQMLVVNAEYQRGPVWTILQKQKLIDSVLRGYPIPLIYLHHIVQTAGGLRSERFEIIDGQQRINALADFRDGGFKLLHPIKDDEKARFPDFIKNLPCPWAGLFFEQLSEALQQQLKTTMLRVVKIKTDKADEARDLFIRLQAGMPLNAQEKRDAWPGQFTDYILRLGGKEGVGRYQSHEFFNDLMRERGVAKIGGSFANWLLKSRCYSLRIERTARSAISTRKRLMIITISI